MWEKLLRRVPKVKLSHFQGASLGSISNPLRLQIRIRSRFQEIIFPWFGSKGKCCFRDLQFDFIPPKNWKSIKNDGVGFSQHGAVTGCWFLRLASRLDCTAPDDVQARDLNCTSDTLESTHYHINSSSLEYLSHKQSFLRENNGHRCLRTTIRKQIITIGFEIFFGNAWRRHFQSSKPADVAYPNQKSFIFFPQKIRLPMFSLQSSFRFELKEKGINLFVAGG